MAEVQADRDYRSEFLQSHFLPSGCSLLPHCMDVCVGTTVSFPVTPVSYKISVSIEFRKTIQTIINKKVHLS